jgi:chemoreceptor-like protein with four helix bundle sensory module
MKLSLQTKLLAVLGVVLLLTMVVGALGIIQAGAINDAYAALYSDDPLGTARAAMLAQDIDQTRADIVRYALTTSKTERATLTDDIAKLDQSIDSMTDAIRRGNPDGDLRPALDAFTLAWNHYSQARNSTISAVRRTGAGGQQALSDVQGAQQQSFAAVTTALPTLLSTLQTAAAGTNSQNNATYENARADYRYDCVVDPDWSWPSTLCGAADQRRRAAGGTCLGKPIQRRA